MNRSTRPLVATLMGHAVLGIALIFSGCERPNTLTGIAAAVPHVERFTVLSDVYQIDRQYRSMAGPWSMTAINLTEIGQDEPRQLLWLRGFSAVIVEADGKTTASQEYMCHSNVGFERLMPGLPRLETAIFTLSQGQYEIQFPEGFGLPVVSDEKIEVVTQVLNLNNDSPPTAVRHKLSFDFIRQDASPSTPPPVKPLLHRQLPCFALVEGESGVFGIAAPDAEVHGPGCVRAPDPLGKGQHDEKWMKTGHTFKDPLGQTFTLHWVVPPGRQVNTSLVTGGLALPYDTTVHYIAVHLHPFAESLELRDRTAKRTVFKSYTRQMKGRIGLEHVDFFSSEEGVLMYKDHEYELISIYNNTSDEDQDAMALMYLYLLAQDTQQLPI
jgi:hypothetical protein